MAIGFFVPKLTLLEWAAPHVITLHSVRTGDKGNGYGTAATGRITQWIFTHRPNNNGFMLTVDVVRSITRAYHWTRY